MKSKLKPKRMKENIEYYKWGIFYFNPQDARTFVPKLNRWAGFTFNFASPFTYMIIIGIAAVITLVSILKK